MKYHMRRTDREITDKEQLQQILKNGKFAAIAMSVDNDPYLVTLSYGYDAANRRFYFHTAEDGQKIEYLRRNPRVCLMVVEDGGYLQGECAHVYRSVVVRGRMAFVEDEAEKNRGFDVLLNQLERDPEIMRATIAQRPKRVAQTRILRLDVEEMSGKEGR